MLSSLAFWTMVSTLMPARAKGSKREAAIPGLSGMPMIVILAVSRSWAIPLSLFLDSMGSPPCIRVPCSRLKLDATRMGMS